ncbi:MAG TPA: DUF5103 domain-containing protein [Bacteroidales bacterium]|nr:DUF5103 domain-containing protein [Bacteroidales bacterium]HSA43154.1 DUF5103 domain-containing protein [Bacteroidales bacterium]
MKNLLLIVSALLLLPLFTPAQTQREYFRENYLRYHDHIYTPNIKTPLLYREGWELGQARLVLGGTDKLLLEFDDLDGGNRNYLYTVIHCSPDWLPSPLDVNQYLDGYYEDRIEDYAYSYNTLQPYTHYNLRFPNERFGIRLSGNYLLVVFPEDKREEPVLSLRFWVVDPKVKITGEVKRPVVIEDKDEKQQLLFRIKTGTFPIINPYQNLKVIIRQNGRWDNMISNLQPLLVKGDELDYTHDAGNIFFAGNEYRHADLKSVKTPGDRVRKIEPGEPSYDIILANDERRQFKVYITEEDINGRFVVRTTDGTDPSTEADYVWVHFTLPYFPLAADGNIFLSGALTRWQLGKENRMTYNFERKAYELKLFLKQGYYNYAYLFLENGAVQADHARIEGNHHETENEYTIYVYYQAPGNEYQELIAVETIKSR